MAKKKPAPVPIQLAPRDIIEKCPCGGTYTDTDYERVLTWRSTHAHHIAAPDETGKRGETASTTIGFVPDTTPMSGSRWGWPTRPYVVETPSEVS